MVTSRVPELDGIRGIAILLVLLLHFSILPLYNGPGEMLLRALLGIGIGWTGVDLFFVLSGFLITGILIETKGTPGYFRTFYIRRFLRIFPLYYATLAVFFWVFMPLTGLKAQPGEILWYLGYLSNWRTAFGPEIPGISHTWSLGIEEQFYMLWPLVVYSLSERSLRWVCGAIALSILVLRISLMWSLDPLVLYRATPFRMDGLALGSLLASIARNPTLTSSFRRFLRPALLSGLLLFGAAVACAATTAWDNPYMSSFGFTGTALVGVSCVFHAFDTSGTNTRYARLLRRGLLQSFGKYCYALYLLHGPVSLVCRFLLRRLPLDLGYFGNLWLSLVSIVLGIVISYLLARLSWRFLEAPCLRWKDTFTYRMQPAVSTSASDVPLGSHEGANAQQSAS